MKSALFIIVIVACVSAQFSFTAITEILKVHNDLRSAIAKGTYNAKGTLEPAAANMRKIKWDASLALSAQKIVNKCSNGFSETSGVGENVFRLWSFAPPVNLDYLGVVASKSWEKEFQTFGWTSLLFDRKTSDSHIGHATQMAWAETNMMGCGVKNCKKDPNMYMYMVVCHYKKPGNLLDNNIYEKGDTCSSCPPGSKCETSSGFAAEFSTAGRPENVFTNIFTAAPTSLDEFGVRFRPSQSSMLKNG